MNRGKGHGAWSKECPKRMGVVNKLRERKSIMKGTEQEVLQILRQLFKCFDMKKFNELVMIEWAKFSKTSMSVLQTNVD